MFDVEKNELIIALVTQLSTAVGQLDEAYSKFNKTLEDESLIFRLQARLVAISRELDNLEPGSSEGLWDPAWFHSPGTVCTVQ